MMKNNIDFEIINDKVVQQQKEKYFRKFVYIVLIILLVLFVIIGIFFILKSNGRSKNKVSSIQLLSQGNHDGPQVKTDQSLVCRSYIPFSIDVSTKLTPEQFKYMKSFLLHPFLSSVFPEDIQPAPFSTYSEQNHGYRRLNNVSDITNFVINVAQGNSDYSFITRPLKYFVDQNVINLSTSELVVNTIIFAGNSLANADILTAKNYTSILTANGNTLTVVLVNPNIDQTNYRQVPKLNIVVWSDPATTIAAIESYMNCGFLLSTTTTTTLITSAISATNTTPFTTESTSTVSTTTTIAVPVCKSYIPFSFDVSTDLTATQFADLKAFLVNPFLESVFSQDVQPAWYSTYDSTNHNYTRPGNVADVINGVQSSIQSAATTSDFIQPLQYLVDQGVADLGWTNELTVNSIIFAGSALDDVDTATFYATTLTSNRNTLTVVLVNPNIDQTNYRRVPGLNIVVWSDTVTTINAIRNFMNCTSLPSITTVTTTTGIATASSTRSSATTFISSVSTKSTSAGTSTNISISTTMISVQVCKSYIPFSFDISLKLNSVQFSDLKTFLVNPFLDSLFPTNVQPLWYSTYANANFAPRNRPSNVSEIINYVQTAVIQGTATTSNFSAPLVYFITKNIIKIGETDGFNVNTVVFAGDSLPFADIATVQNYTSILTTNGNTLTVVLMNPNIDTNYRQITGLKIVVWSDTATSITAIRNHMNCSCH